MKTAEDILSEFPFEDDFPAYYSDKTIIAAMEAYADQFRAGRVGEQHQQALKPFYLLAKEVLSWQNKADKTVLYGYNHPQLSQETN